MASKGSNTREKGRRAGANAPPTPKKRLEYPPILEKRLKAAGIVTRKGGK